MTYEEIKEKYPIGFVLESYEVNIHNTKVYYTPKDIEEYKKQYTTIKVYPNNICECFRTDTYENKVEGWLFDGKGWYVVKDSCDGWTQYSNEELEKFEISRVKQKYYNEHLLDF